MKKDGSTEWKKYKYLGKPQDTAEDIANRTILANSGELNANTSLNTDD